MEKVKSISGLICLLVIIMTFVLGLMIQFGGGVTIGPLVFLGLIFALAVAFLFG